jgi:hypothetical protein
MISRSMSVTKTKTLEKKILNKYSLIQKADLSSRKKRSKKNLEQMASPKRTKSLARRIGLWKTYLSASISILASTQLRLALSPLLAVFQIKGRQ